MTELESTTTRYALTLVEKFGISTFLLLVLGAVYLGYFPSPLLDKLEAHDTSVNETVRIARLQCAFLARLAKADGTPCFNVDISRGTPKLPPMTGGATR